MAPSGLEKLTMFNSAGNVNFEDELKIMENGNSQDIKQLFNDGLEESNDSCDNYDLNSINRLSSANDSNIMKGSKLFLGLLFNYLTPELLRRFILAGLNLADEMVKKTPNQVDDIIVNELTNRIRLLLGDTNQQYQTPNYGLEGNRLLSEKLDHAENVCNELINIDLGEKTNLFANMSTDLNNKLKKNPFEE